MGEVVGYLGMGMIYTGILPEWKTLRQLISESNVSRKVRVSGGRVSGRVSTAAVGTHQTGLLSCSLIFLGKFYPIVYW